MPHQVGSGGAKKPGIGGLTGDFGDFGATAFGKSGEKRHGVANEGVTGPPVDSLKGHNFMAVWINRTHLL